ncbi:MAG: cytochrome P450 [Gammaproteobacteria bacterium]|nr:cytochrome P450 [Gammaproteobacteria bacterium]
MEEITQIDIPLRELVRGLKTDYFGYLQGLINTHGPIFSFPLKLHTVVIVESPPIINHILSENKDNYLKGAEVVGTSYHYLKAVFGDSLIVMDNPPLWTKHRRVVMPSLQRANYPTYAETIVSNCLSMIEKCQQDLKKGPSINISRSITVLAMRALFNTLFHTSDFDYEKLVDVTDLAKVSNRGSTFKKMVNLYDTLMEDFIQRRLGQKTPSNDLLDAFLAAYHEEPDQALALTLIRNELKGFILAGHETVATSLTWAFYLLAQNPEWQNIINDEHAEVLNGRLPQYSDLEKLPKTLAVFKEVLRLYPPVYTIPRVAVADDVAEDLRIPKGSYIMIPVYHVHRDAKYWPEPEVFNPERFLGAGLSEAAQKAYLPFGLGQRSCIGREFATMEACLVLTLMCSQFQFTLPKNFVFEKTATNVLWPKQALELMVVERV